MKVTEITNLTHHPEVSYMHVIDMQNNSITGINTDENNPCLNSSVAFPTIDEVVPYNEAIRGFIDDHNITIPVFYKSASAYLRQRGYMPSFYSYRNKLALLESLKWLCSTSPETFESSVCYSDLIICDVTKEPIENLEGVIEWNVQKGFIHVAKKWHSIGYAGENVSDWDLNGIAEPWFILARLLLLSEDYPEMAPQIAEVISKVFSVKIS